MSVRFWAINGAVRSVKRILRAMRRATREERRHLLEQLQIMRKQKVLVKG